MFRRPHALHRAIAARSHLLVLALALATSGCSGGGGGGEPDPPPPGDAGQPPSSRARVKFKGTHRIANDLAQALALARQDLCRELGAHDCFEAHDIVLGGVEPYRLRIDEPLPTAPVTGPMAVDRVALSACGERAARDFAAPDQAVLFADIARSSGMPSASARAAVARRLYERLLARVAEPAELDALVDFAGALQDSPAPARAWAQLACYAVATTTEFLFY